MTTIKYVARLAGVSPSTVSKYINGGHVRLENLEAIRRAIDKLDYRVNPFARNLKARCSRSIGVLLPSISASFYGAVFMALDKVLRERGYHTMISCYNANHGLERDYLNYLISTGVDGLVYMPEDLTADEFGELTAGRSVPVVQVDRMIPGADGQRGVGAVRHGAHGCAGAPAHCHHSGAEGGADGPGAAGGLSAGAGGAEHPL